MKKLLTLFIVLISSFTLLSACENSEKKETNTGPKIKSEGELTLGEWNGSKYTNPFFGFSFEVSEDYNILSKEEIAMLTNIGKEYLAESNESFAEIIEKMKEEQTLYLGFVLKHPLTYSGGFNPNIQFMVENLKVTGSENIVTTGAQFLSIQKDVLEQTGLDYNFKDISSVKIDDIDFDLIEISSVQMGINIEQKMYARKIDDYMFVIIITASDDEGLQDMDEIVDSITFNKE